MRGTLYGVGVGPGDPELLTLKAVRRLREADVIAVPGKVREETVAYRIAVQAVPEIAQKEYIAAVMPMTKERELLQKSHEQAAHRIAEMLEAGRDVAFLTLGDPCVYATYLYVDRLVRQMGYPAEIVNGVPSFCTAAARLGVGLAETGEALHILPASYPVEEGLRMPGTKVLMKAGSKLGKVKSLLEGVQGSVLMAENCGMPDERCYYSAREIPEDAGYYSLIIVKDEQRQK